MTTIEARVPTQAKRANPQRPAKAGKAGAKGKASFDARLPQTKQSPATNSTRRASRSTIAF